jgi:hypothetical protein
MSNGTPRSNGISSGKVAMYPLLQRPNPRDISKNSASDRTPNTFYSSIGGSSNTKPNFTLASSPGLSAFFSNSPGKPYENPSKYDEKLNTLPFHLPSEDHENLSDSARTARRSRVPTTAMVGYSLSLIISLLLPSSFHRRCAVDAAFSSQFPRQTQLLWISSRADSNGAAQRSSSPLLTQTAPTPTAPAMPPASSPITAAAVRPTSTPSSPTFHPQRT